MTYNLIDTFLQWDEGEVVGLRGACVTCQYKRLLCVKIESLS